MNDHLPGLACFTFTDEIGLADLDMYAQVKAQVDASVPEIYMFVPEQLMSKVHKLYKQFPRLKIVSYTNIESLKLTLVELARTMGPQVMRLPVDEQGNTSEFIADLYRRFKAQGIAIDVKPHKDDK